MTHGSLFSGIGGFDWAAELAGFENLFHCEWNPFCRKVLKYHFPNSESHEDITKTDFTKWRGKIDILSGGFPCQPFSVAGSRKGAEDDRYLWPEMLRAIEEIRPAWVVGENVAGILTMVLPGEEVEVGGYTDITGESHKEIEERQMYVVERICQDFERIGYSVQPVIIPACAVGAPHRRDRIWFVANRSDAGIETQCSGEDRVFSTGFAANSILRRYERRTDETDGRRQEETGKRIFSETERLGARRIITDPDCKLLSSRNEERYEKWKKENINVKSQCFIPAWSKFPTQSPVCNRDDGLSLGLADISFPKWRMESIKALGNSIVPQVAYEIFKAINETMQDMKWQDN